MPKTSNYERYKLDIDNTTGMLVTLHTGESDVGVAAVAGGGVTGILHSEHHADADESGGVDVQPVFRIVSELVITDTADKLGSWVLTVSVLAIAGGGAVTTVQGQITVAHPETPDAWQAAAGRARQA